MPAPERLHPGTWLRQVDRGNRESGRAIPSMKGEVVVAAGGGGGGGDLIIFFSMKSSIAFFFF